MSRRKNALRWFYKGKKLIPLRVGALIVGLVLMGALLMQLQSAGYLKSQAVGIGDYFAEPSPDSVALPTYSCVGDSECPSGMLCGTDGQCFTPSCRTGNDCPENQYCDYYGLTCLDKKESGESCYPGECAGDMECINRVCAPPSVPPPVDPTPPPTPTPTPVLSCGARNYATNQYVSGPCPAGKQCVAYQQYNLGFSPAYTTRYRCVDGNPSPTAGN